MMYNSSLVSFFEHMQKLMYVTSYGRRLAVLKTLASIKLDFGLKILPFNNTLFFKYKNGEKFLKTFL